VTGILGAACELDVATSTLTGQVRYEHRLPNPALTDWGPITTSPAGGFLVVTARPDAGALAIVDAQLTAEDGAFAVAAPSPAATGDLLFVVAARLTPSGIAYAVADPGLPASRTPYAPQHDDPARVWSWSVPLTALAPGATITIDDDAFSGAARVFDRLRSARDAAAARWPDAPATPLVVWLAPEVSFTCGACFASFSARAFGATFQGQIFIGGGADEAYWADAVTTHELGHWIMATFGRSVGEGGVHCLGVPTSPGLAWSEGFATWFGCDLLGSPLYVDKQDGTFFWLDLARRDGDAPWPRPLAQRGLEQDIYELEISAMMWRLVEDDPGHRARFDRALASPRMTVPPFERGYHVHAWDTDGCTRTDIQDTGVSTTHFADFLDAARCLGVPGAAVDAVTEPELHYPYPSESPRCR
jgi:hypothetical protein